MFDKTKVNKRLKRLSKAQLNTYEYLSDKGKVAYLSSLFGISQRNLNVCRPKHAMRPSLTKQPTVYANSGDCLKTWLRLRADLYRVDKYKKPTDQSGDWLAVEIECYLPTENYNHVVTECTGDCRQDCTCYDCADCGQHCEDRECSCECDCTNGSYIEQVQSDLTKLKIKNIQVDRDGSLSDDSDKFGLEVKVLFKLTDYSNLTAVCKYLNDKGAIVNTDTGLHVHLDARRLVNKEIVIKRFESSLPFLVKMIPQSRQKNTYCRYGASTSERYYMINGTALEKHGTIEIRMHSGTTDLTKIVNWCTLLQAIKTCEFLAPQARLDWFISLGISFELQHWCEARMAKFNGNDSEDTNHDTGTSIVQMTSDSVIELMSGPL